MWQRVQTLYLSLALICIFLAILFPIFQLSAGEHALQFDVYGIKAMISGETESYSALPLYIIYILMGILALVTIFSFKNRKRQLAMGRINFLISLLLTVFLLLFSFWGVELASVVEGEDVMAGVEHEVSLGLGFFFSIAILPLIFLANLGIKRDEKLIRSLDRLR